MTVVKFRHSPTSTLWAKDRAAPLTCQRVGLQQLNQGFPLAGNPQQLTVTNNSEAFAARDVTVQLCSTSLLPQQQRCALSDGRLHAATAALGRKYTAPIKQ